MHNHYPTGQGSLSMVGGPCGGLLHGQADIGGKMVQIRAVLHDRVGWIHIRYGILTLTIPIEESRIDMKLIPG